MAQLIFNIADFGLRFKIKDEKQMQEDALASDQNKKSGLLGTTRL